MPLGVASQGVYEGTEMAVTARGSTTPARRMRLHEIVSRWRVEVAWLALLIVPFAHPTRASIAGGALPVVLGLALRAWGRGYLERGVYLAQGGPYAYIRHPLYVGSGFVALGFAIMLLAPALVTLLVAVAFVAMYRSKIVREDAYLHRLYGSEYDAYAARVPAVIPRLAGAHATAAAAAQRFSWRRVLEKGEWRTWLGVSLATVAVVVDAVLRS